MLAFGDRVRRIRHERGLSIQDLVNRFERLGITMSIKRWRGIEAEGTAREGSYSYRPLTLYELHLFCQITASRADYLVNGKEPWNAQNLTRQDNSVRNLLVSIERDLERMSAKEIDALNAFWSTFISRQTSTTDDGNDGT